MLGAPVIQRIRGEQGRKLLEHEPLPARAELRIAFEGKPIVDTEQPVQQTGVPDVDLG